MTRAILVLLCFAAITSNGQFKADNVKYKTVFPQDLCKALADNPGFVLLDVRSQGEFADTLSSSEDLNIGHLEGARHIDIRELPARWKELSDLKDKPLFIYCSHSQRSRRASRLLADSGFTKVFNINGGLTDFYIQGIESAVCPGTKIVTTVPYQIVSAKEFENNMKQGTPYLLIDLRSDSAFRGTISDEKTRTTGKFSDAMNIPFEKLTKQQSLVIPDQPVLLIDQSGDESPLAAKFLVGKGKKNISILFGGMDGWLEYAAGKTISPAVKWKTSAPYKLIAGEQLTDPGTKNPPMIIDVRSKAEFSGTSPNYWQNIGQISGAVNIPASEIQSSTALPRSKKQPIVLYSFHAQPDVFAAAKSLTDRGYKNVSVLVPGIWGIRWQAHNLSGKDDLSKMVVNVPAENQ